MPGFHYQFNPNIIFLNLANTYTSIINDGEFPKDHVLNIRFPVYFSIVSSQNINTELSVFLIEGHCKEHCHILFVHHCAPIQLGGVIKRISPLYHIGFESYFTSFRRTVRYFQFIHKVRNTDKDNIAKWLQRGSSKTILKRNSQSLPFATIAFMYNTVGHVVTSAECHFMIHSLVRARNCEKGVFMRARK